MTTAKKPNRSAPPWAIRTACPTLVLACVILLGACAGGGPSVSGWGLGNTRVVKVGEVVEFRLPMGPDGSRQWRVTSYDSLYLSVAGPPRPARKADGSFELLVRATARTQGETEIGLTEVGTSRVVRYTIGILE
jgi:hypothetical protein